MLLACSVYHKKFDCPVLLFTAVIHLCLLWWWCQRKVKDRARQQLINMQDRVWIIALNCQNDGQPSEFSIIVKNIQSMTENICSTRPLLLLALTTLAWPCIQCSPAGTQCQLRGRSFCAGIPVQGARRDGPRDGASATRPHAAVRRQGEHRALYGTLPLNHAHSLCLSDTLSPSSAFYSTVSKGN